MSINSLLSLSFLGGKRDSDDQCRWFTSGAVADSSLFSPGYTCVDGSGQYNNSKWSCASCCVVIRQDESVNRNVIYTITLQQL